jgi:hypothetical protein
MIFTPVETDSTPVKMSEMVKETPSLVMEATRFQQKLDAWTIGGSARVSRAGGPPQGVRASCPKHRWTNKFEGFSSRRRKWRPGWLRSPSWSDGRK